MHRSFLDSVPKCLRHWCRSVLRHFGTGVEVSRAGPKCLVAEVSGNLLVYDTSLVYMSVDSSVTGC